MHPIPTAAEMSELLAVAQRPCLSLYQQTLRAPTNPQRNPDRFEKLYLDLGRLLQLRYPRSNRQRLLARCAALAKDEDFWQRTGAGLAVLGGPNFVRVFVLPFPVADMTVVGARFDTLPIALANGAPDQDLDNPSPQESFQAMS